MDIKKLYLPFILMKQQNNLSTDCANILLLWDGLWFSNKLEDTDVYFMYFQVVYFN